MGVWNKVKLGEFLTPYRIEHIIQSEQDYKQVTISKSGTISLRGVQSGSKIGRKRQFEINLNKYPNTVLFTRQGVLDGAIGIAPTNIDQCVVTENMPMMSVDTDIIAIEYLRKLLLSDYFFEKVRKLKIVGSAQKSIHERDLLEIEIDLPDKDSQMEICKKFHLLDTEQLQLSLELAHQQTLLKKLRQQILQEAIEGKLTADWRAQNPDVEPASELLKRIAAEKAQLVKEKKIKEQKTLPPIKDEEKPFKLLQGWAWCRTNDACSHIIDCPHSTPKFQDSGKYCIDTTCINMAGNILIQKIRKVNNETFEERNSRLKPNSGDIVYSREGIVGQAVIIPEGWEVCLGQRVMLFRPFFEISSHFFRHVVTSRFFLEEMFLRHRGAGAKHVNMKDLRDSWIPLPPLAEQQAIVAKVEKLLAICDQLEARITQNQTYAEQLMQAVLKEAFYSGPQILDSGLSW